MDNLIGPLPFVHDDRGDYRSPWEERRRLDQCYAERRRMLDALGWWDEAPPLPDMLKNEHPIFQAVA